MALVSPSVLSMPHSCSTSIRATIRSFTLATTIIPRLLWPGTPSNVVFLSFVRNHCRRGMGCGARPRRREAAFVILGAIVGAAVEATVIMLFLLCPGTLANICAWRSFEISVRGPAVAVFSIKTPARSAAALVVRGTISSFSFVTGIGRALNSGFPFSFNLPWPLLPPIAKGFVSFEGAYPSSSAAAAAAR